MLKHILRNNTPQDWLFALLALCISMLVFELIRRFILRRLDRMHRPDYLVARLFMDVVSATRILLPAAIGVYAATQFLNLPPAGEKVADRAFLSLLMLQSGFWASRVLDFWLRTRFDGTGTPTEGSRTMTRTWLSFLGRVVLWSLAALLILDNLGINITALVASLGIGGIAVALAVQNILGDLFASLSIAIDQPFVIGDFIVVDDLMGTVEHVGLKTTRLRSLSGEQLIFSNNDLLKSRIRNYKRMQERRIEFGIGVTYDTPIEKLERIPDFLREAIAAQNKARFDRAHFKGFGPSSLDFEAVYHVLDPDYPVYMDVQQAINLHLLRELGQHGISLAFPTQTVYLAGPLPPAVTDRTKS
ncbi:MAG: mechanosensitive ion channel [Gammaproteobacteria bacterium]|nr:mechanosensitive ion channel [Gammaproteobacteria bacterium]